MPQDEQNSVIDAPSRLDPAVNAAFSGVRPCPECNAENRHLWPMMSVEQPRRFAIGCHECGYIGDDAPTVADAVALWNNDRQRPASHQG